jgi:hypothetical protein
MSQTITAPTVGSNMGFAAVQTYSYDSVNRLKDATENITPNGGSQTQAWKQTFTFDRFGTTPSAEAAATPPKTGGEPFDKENTTLPASFENQAVTNPTISPNTNRLTSTGYSFDSSGNTIRYASDRKFACGIHALLTRALPIVAASFGDS